MYYCIAHLSVARHARNIATISSQASLCLQQLILVLQCITHVSVFLPMDEFAWILIYDVVKTAISKPVFAHDITASTVLYLSWARH